MDMILFTLAFLVGLVVGLMWSVVAIRDYREQVKQLDRANDLWKRQCMALDQRNRELERKQQQEPAQACTTISAAVYDKNRAETFLWLRRECDD